MSQLTENRPSFFGRDDKPFGRDMEYWVRKWWNSQHYAKWRRNIAKVFFLEGRHKSQTELEWREYQNVDSSKPIFWPPINYFAVYKKAPGTKEELTAQAKHEMDIIDPNSTIKIKIDDEWLTEGWFRCGSGGFFDDLGQQIVSDGYWIMLKPRSLSPGKHRIYSFGSCRQGTVSIFTNYTLYVK